MQQSFGITFLILASSSVLRAQHDRQLVFAWPVPATVVVTNENTRDDRSFTLCYELDIRAGSAPDSLVIGRRNSRITRWNGKPVPDAARPRLAPLELSMDMLPDCTIATDGRYLAVESRDQFLTRCRGLATAASKAGTPRHVIDEAVATVSRPAHFAVLALQAERQWNEWIGRWLDLEFAEQAADSFQGEIELVTGDLVDGTFEVEHLGQAPDDAELVRLRVDFAASGARLDSAALQWRQEAFGRDGESFEKVELTVRELTEIATRPATMQPARISSVRTSTVRVSDETKEFVERRVWEFEWK